MVKNLRISVKEIKGHCDIMHVGDYFEVHGSRLSIPKSPYFCYWAIQSITPMLPAKQRILKEDGDWMSTTWEIECPDPAGQVILKIEEIE